MPLLIWLKESLFNFLFPERARVLHLESLTTAKLLDILPSCERIESENIVALFNYQNSLVKEIIWGIKYNGNKVLAERLGEILFDTIMAELSERNIFEKTGNVILMPMPISDRRRFERGWNQTELITEAVKSNDASQKLKYLPRQLAKVIHTESQTRTSGRKERRENLHNSMRVINPLSVKDRYVVLIDDVTTTGSTFKEAVRALKVAEAKKVLCFAVAH